MKMSMKEFKEYVNGICYDMENDQLYVSNGEVAATIENPFEPATTFEEGEALEAKAEADASVWEELYNDYIEEA